MILSQWDSVSLHWKKKTAKKENYVNDCDWEFWVWGFLFLKLLLTTNVLFLSLILNTHIKHWFNNIPYLWKTYKDAFIQDHPKKTADPKTNRFKIQQMSMSSLLYISTEYIFSPLIFHFSGYTLGLHLYIITCILKVLVKDTSEGQSQHRQN